MRTAGWCCLEEVFDTFCSNIKPCEKHLSLFLSGHFLLVLHYISVVSTFTFNTLTTFYTYISVYKI